MLAPLAVSVVLLPLQIVALAGEIETVGVGVTVTVAAAVPEQVVASVTVSEYDVLAVGETTMEVVVSEVLHA